MKRLLLCVLVFGLVGCSKTSVMNAEFSSMDECLGAIKNNSNKDLDIVIDKVGHISGYLNGTKLDFSCETEATGTRGLIVKGWYEVNN